MDTSQQPRVLGTLIAVLGICVVIAAYYAYANLGGGAEYFAVVGLGYFATGLLLYHGREEAVHAFTITLLIIWVWSMKEVGLDLIQLFHRVGLSTLLGVYIFSSQVRSRLGRGHAHPAALEELTDAELQSVELKIDRAGAMLGISLRVLSWAFFLYGAKEMLAMLNKVAGSEHTFGYALHAVWITSPFIVLGWFSVRGERDFFRDGAMLFGSAMAYFLGLGVYYMNVTPSTTLQQTHIFVVLPLVQLIWAGAWIFLLRKKSVAAPE